MNPTGIFASLLFLLALVFPLPAGTLETVSGPSAAYSVYTLDPKTESLELYWKDANGKIYNNFRNLENGLKARGRKLEFATNAGIFEEGYIPTGLLVAEGQDILPLNLNPGRGNFFLQPNGVFLLSKTHPYIVASEKWFPFTHKVTCANQSGPMLVIDGRIHPAFTENSASKYIRSGVGITSQGKVAFALSKTPVNLFDFAAFFQKTLGCKNALYLDGSISKFYQPGGPRVRETQEAFAAFFAVTTPL